MSKIFDKLIVHTTYLYLDEALKQDVCYQRDKLTNLKSKLAGLHIGYKFTDDEHRQLVEAGKTPEAERIKSIEIDFAVYAISLIGEYISQKDKKDRIVFNMSDKKVRDLQATLIKDMLSLKHRDDTRYSNTKEIVYKSRLAAKQYYHYFEENL